MSKTYVVEDFIRTCDFVEIWQPNHQLIDDLKMVNTTLHCPIDLTRQHIDVVRDALQRIKDGCYRYKIMGLWKLTNNLLVAMDQELEEHGDRYV